MGARIETPDWVRDAVFYQIFPDRFARGARPTGAAAEPMRGERLDPWGAPPRYTAFQGGDLWGVTERLDHLAALGVNALYFTPIFASTANHRYATADYFRIDPLLGGDAALRALLDAAHDRGMRVVLDGVFNHVGRAFFPFQSVLEQGLDSPYLDWFHIDRARLAQGKRLDAYLPDPILTKEEAEAGGGAELGYHAWWGLPSLPKLNTGCAAVREMIYRVAEHWLAFGIDGWRLDVPAEIDDDAFWRGFRTRVRALREDAYIVGEVWTDARRWLQGDQFDAVMNYLFTRPALGFALHGCLDGEAVARSGLRDVRPMSGEACGAALEQALALYAPEINAVQMNLLGSHDTPRVATMARGNPAAVKLAMTMMFTFVGAPMIYYGDEVGLPGAHDPDCRRAFPWDHEAAWDRDILQHVARLGSLRRRIPALRRGDLRFAYADHSLLAYTRRAGGSVAVVVLNNAGEERSAGVPVPGVDEDVRLVDVLGAGEALVERGAVKALRVPARGAVVLVDAASAG